MESDFDRQEAYARLAAAAQRVGLPLERLHSMLSQVAQNEAETRRFLADNVYGVSDELLDDLVRVRMADLAGDPTAEDPPEE